MEHFVKRKILVIINPVSGTKSKKGISEKIKEVASPELFDVEVVYTEYEGHAVEIASRGVRDKFDYVIAVGGDGTINEVAKALIHTDVVLGIVPSGSGNGLARELFIPMNRQKAIRIITEGVVKAIDYGIANDNVFFCTCGVGFDAQVSEKALTRKKRGVWMYAQDMLSTFYKFNPERYKVSCNEGSFDGEAFVVTCANASQYGNNAYIAPHADIQDGKMNITVLKPLSALNVPKAAIQMFSRNLANNKRFVEFITPEAVIERGHAGVMHLDGNAIYTGEVIRVQVVRQALKVLVPRTVPKSSLAARSFITNITRWL
jgi:YegS/Rv2252/BmrU family lipid kinase